MQHRELTMVDLTETYVGRTPAFQALFEKPDGSYHQHTMPRHTLAARSVEHDIPLDAVDIIWDVVVHEPFAVSPEDETSVKAYGFDPAALVGLVAPNLGRNSFRLWDELIGVDCFRAETIDDGRDATLLRSDLCQHRHTLIRDPKGVRLPALRYRQDKNWIAWYKDDFAQAREATLAQVREALRAAAR